MPGKGRYLLHCSLRIAFSSYNEKSIDKRMDEVIGIEFTRGITICEIGKEELHQKQQIAIRQKPRFADGSFGIRKPRRQARLAPNLLAQRRRKANSASAGLVIALRPKNGTAMASLSF